MQRTPASSGGVFLYADTPHLCGSVSIQKNIAVTAVRCIESPKRSPTEAPPPAEHYYSTATRRTCAEVSAHRKILPWQRCAALSLPQPKSKILPGDPGCSLHRSFVACKTSSGLREAPPQAEHYYSAAFFLLGLRCRRNDTASNLQMLRILRQCKSPHSHICVADFCICRRCALANSSLWSEWRDL